MNIWQLGCREQQESLIDAFPDGLKQIKLQSAVTILWSRRFVIPIAVEISATPESCWKRGVMECVSLSTTVPMIRGPARPWATLITTNKHQWILLSKFATVSNVNLTILQFLINLVQFKSVHLCFIFGWRQLYCTLSQLYIKVYRTGHSYEEKIYLNPTCFEMNEWQTRVAPALPVHAFFDGNSVTLASWVL